MNKIFNCFVCEKKTDKLLLIQKVETVTKDKEFDSGKFIQEFYLCDEHAKKVASFIKKLRREQNDF